MRSRRALLYMPADDWHKINKAVQLGVDCVCMDLEDGVAPGRKGIARETIIRALEGLPFARSERLVRINAPGSGLEADDLDAVLPARPDGVVVPKVTSADQVRWVSAQIAAHEQAGGWPPEQIRLLAIVETAQAVLDLREIAAADARLEALIFGAEDLAVDLGATRSPEGWEVFYARSAVVTAAAAYGLQALDMVYVTFRDLDGLQAEARQGARMGFSGKQVIHPVQVDPVQAAFTPGAAEIERARQVIAAYQAHQDRGVGVFAQEGAMVDLPMVRAAQRVLARARAAGVIET